jgi:exopolysaccharide biosynthesis polyprenyl glycosylphosphotransferase
VIRIFNRSVSIRSVALRIAEALLVVTTLLVACSAGSSPLAWTATTYFQVAVVGAIILLCLSSMDSYEPYVTSHRERGLSRIFQAFGLTMLIIALVRYTWPWVVVDVPSILIGLVILGVSLAISRCLFAELVTNPSLAEPAVVWGSGALAASIIHELRARPDIGIRVVGIVERGYAGRMFEGVRYLGSPEVLWTLAGSGPASRIIVALGERRGLPVERLMELKAAGLNVEDGTELFEELTGRVWLDGFSIASLLFSRRLRRSSIGLFFNRIFSVLFALITLIVAAPVMLITAVLIRLDSEGPAILCQKRVGQNGRLFTLFKFRSMYADADRTERLVPAAQDDPRITRVGHWIRRFRIDELPQLFNILKGDMYFVGPRPFVPDQEATLVREIPYYQQRWAVRPGATGWAQVNRDYCASIADNVEKLSYDLFYIKNRSMGLDMLTLMKTFKILLLGRGGR